METVKTKTSFRAYDTIYLDKRTANIKYWFLGVVGFLAICMFLPWTQNIKAKGTITSLFQEQRPQDIHSPIPGRISKWWVREGDIVAKGDTILQLSEIKEDYLDPELVARTQEQLNAKREAITSYQGKVEAAGAQIEALKQARELKISQLQNKLRQLDNKLAAETAELQAAQNDFNLAKDQFERQQLLFKEGLVSQTQLQQRNASFQNASAKKTAAENKLRQTRQEVQIVKLEQRSAIQEYTEKISKAESDRFQSQSQIASSQGEAAKLQNQVANYTVRSGMYFILAPQAGQIVQAKKAGIGEVLKEGERITLIIPDKANYAVEMYVRPVDLPLVSVGQKVRFMFDGFPAIVFSGWPNSSYGTFGGKIVAYDNSISPNGLFRVLVAEDKTDRPWPPQLKFGNGAQGIALLKEVPVWYELWRNINGFPPDYYQLKEEGDAKTDAKPK